jgi:hypothetical protein
LKNKDTYFCLQKSQNYVQAPSLSKSNYFTSSIFQTKIHLKLPGELYQLSHLVSLITFVKIDRSLAVLLTDVESMRMFQFKNTPTETLRFTETLLKHLGYCLAPIGII